MLVYLLISTVLIIAHRYPFLAAGQSYLNPNLPDLAPNDECFANLEAVMNPNTKIQGLEVKLVGCLSTDTLDLEASDIPYNLPFDYDYHTYWDQSGQFYVSRPGGTSFNASAHPEIVAPAGDSAISNYYNESVVRGYKFRQAVPWVQPYYYPTIPSSITNIVDVAENDQIEHERDSCAVYCNQLYIDQSRASYTSAAASTETIRFALAYGRCTCLGPVTSSSIEIGKAVNPMCCTPMPTSARNVAAEYAPNVETDFAPQPSNCYRQFSYAVVYQLSLTCPTNTSYCDYKLKDCVSKSVNTRNKKCCMPIGAVSVYTAPSDSGLVIEGSVMQWLIGAIIIIIITQFAYWVFHARKRARLERLANEENQLEAVFLGGDGTHVLAHRLLIPGDGASEDGVPEDVVGRMPSWQEVEREMALRNRIAARQELEIVLVPSPNNGLPMSVVIRGRAAEERDSAATEAMLLLQPVLEHVVEDDELCCPICTEALKEEVYGVKTLANHRPLAKENSADLEKKKERENEDEQLLQLDLAEAAVAAQLAPSRGASRRSLEGNVDIELVEIVVAQTSQTELSQESTSSPSSREVSRDAKSTNNKITNNGGTSSKNSSKKGGSTPRLSLDVDITEGGGRPSFNNSLNECSNVVALACRHLIHRECMHEYMAHVVKSYLAPITCPLCRGIVVLQNLASEQEVLKRSLLEFRFLVESELLRLVQLGAMASPSIVPNPSDPMRNPARIILADGEDAPIRTNSQLIEILRAAQFGFVDIPSLPPIAPLPAPVFDISNDPFSVLAPLQLQVGGHRRDTIPLGPGMRVRPSRRDVVALRVALVSRLRLQLEGSVLLSHTRVPGMGDSVSDYAQDANSPNPLNIRGNGNQTEASLSRESSRGGFRGPTNSSSSSGFQHAAQRPEGPAASSSATVPRSPVLRVPTSIERSEDGDSSIAFPVVQAPVAKGARAQRSGSISSSLTNQSIVSNNTAVPNSSRETSTGAATGEDGLRIDSQPAGGISEPLSVAPLNLSRGLSRPAKVVRRRGLSVHGRARSASRAQQPAATSTTATTSTVQAIAALPGRAVGAIASALGVTSISNNTDSTTHNGDRPPRLAPSRLVNVYEAQIAGIDQMSPLSPPRDDDYAAADGDAIGYYEEIRGSPRRDQHGSSSEEFAPASPTAVTADGQRIQRVVAPPPQTRKATTRRRSTSTVGRSSNTDARPHHDKLRVANSVSKAAAPPPQPSSAEAQRPHRDGSISGDEDEEDRPGPAATIVTINEGGLYAPPTLPNQSARELSFDDDL